MTMMTVMMIMDDDDNDVNDLDDDNDDEDYGSDDGHPYLVSSHHLQENPTYHTGGFKTYSQCQLKGFKHTSNINTRVLDIKISRLSMLDGERVINISLLPMQGF